MFDILRKITSPVFWFLCLIAVTAHWSEAKAESATGTASVRFINLMDYGFTAEDVDWIIWAGCTIILEMDDTITLENCDLTALPQEE